MMNTIVFIEYVNAENKLCPSKTSLNNAGYDLYSTEDVTINANSSALVSTGIKLILPHGNYGSIRSRSGLAVKNIEAGAGVIDNNYQGEIKVLLRNFNNENYNVAKGDRIAQLIIQPYVNVDFNEVASLADQQESDRGNNGFGSSGR